jgi:hypothetical protein
MSMHERLAGLTGQPFTVSRSRTCCVTLKDRASPAGAADLTKGKYSMKKTLFGALAALVLTAGVADAQYYGGPRYYEGPRYGYDRPPPPRPAYGYGRVGYTCVAVRGTVCRLGRPAPLGAYCECYRREGGKREGYVSR